MAMTVVHRSFAQWFVDLGLGLVFVVAFCVDFFSKSDSMIN